MTQHNYFEKKSQDDHVFLEFDCHLDFVFDEILTNVMPRSQSNANHNYIEWMVFVMRLQLV